MKYFSSLALIFLVFIAKAQSTDQSKDDAPVPKQAQKWLVEKTSKGMIKMQNMSAESSTM